MTGARPSAPLVVAAFAVTLWGLTPVATKVAVDAVDPIVVGILRMTIAGLVAWPAILLLRLSPPRARGLVVLLAISTVTGMIVFPLLFTVGQRLTSASHAALILAAQPLFTGIVAASVERRLPPRAWWIGAAVALSGEFALVSGRELEGGGATLFGDMVVLAAGFIASVGYVAGGRLQQSGYAALSATLWSVAIASVVLAPALSFLTTIDQLARVPALPWAAIAHLAIGSSIIAYVGWYWSLGVGGIARIGLVQFLQTPVGVFAALLLLGEPLNLPLILSAAAILIGVFIAQRR
ncbi:MAG: DMT family transporter [Rhodospirillaceae bacterium]|nr:DMT family transporter [Rhodospirillaceae bacterium]